MKKYLELAKQIYQTIERFGSTIWSGFESVPFIIYNDEFQIAVGTGFSARYEQVEANIWIATGKDEHLFGDTVTEYHGLGVAIWNVDTWPEDVDVATATSCVYHEMFHAHQYYKFKPIDNAGGMILDYQHKTASVALTIAENQYLLDILANPSKESVLTNLNQLANLRQARLAALGQNYLAYDQAEETIEGTAVYAEIKMAMTISGKSASECAVDYLQLLRLTDDTLARYRARLYSVGLILCLACEYLDLDLQTEMVQSGKSVFAWLTEKLNLPIATVEPKAFDLNFELAQQLLSDFTKIKEEKINAFLAQPHVEVNGVLNGLDPMNLVVHGNLCLHKRGQVIIGGVAQQLQQPYLTEFADGNVFVAKRMWISG